MHVIIGAASPRLRLIVPAFLLDLCRQAVEPPGGLFGAGQRHVADGTRNAPIAVLKGMQGHKPQVRKDKIFTARYAVNMGLNRRTGCQKRAMLIPMPLEPGLVIRQQVP